MTETKRKNLSPNELLQQAKLLHPENEAFVRGMTKELRFKKEITANLYYQTGFSFTPDKLQHPHYNRWSEALGTIAIVAIFTCTGLTLFSSLLYVWVSDFQWGIICPAIVLMPFSLFMMYVGLAALVNLWAIATTSEKKIQTCIVNLTKNGKLILGERVQHGEGKIAIGSSRSSKFLTVSYISPETGKKRYIVWHSWRYTFINIGDNLILLYLTDDSVIVL